MNIYMFCLDALGTNPLKTPDACPQLTDYIDNSNLLYKNTIAPCPFTDCSIISMFTGLYGTLHRADSWGMAEKTFKRDEVVTLPQILTNLGYKSFYVGYNCLTTEASFFDNTYLMDLVQNMKAVGQHTVGFSDAEYRKEHNKKYAEIINKTEGNKLVFVHDMNYHDVNRCLGIDVPLFSWCDETNAEYDRCMKFMDDQLPIKYYDIDFDEDIVIIFPDHGGKTWDEIYLDERFVKTFWAIYAPNTKKRVVEKFYSFVDFLSVFLELLGITDTDICQGKRDGSEYCVSFGGIGNPKFSKWASPNKPNQFLITDSKKYYYRHDNIGEIVTDEWDLSDVGKVESDEKLIEFYKNKMNEILYPDKDILDFYPPELLDKFGLDEKQVLALSGEKK